MSLKSRVKNALAYSPSARKLAERLYAWWTARHFTGSRDYWVERYRGQGTSGDGSYNKLAEFKAEIINGLVADQQIRSVIEFGCGDGNQLRYARYPSYVGFDISDEALARCTALFASDMTKTFRRLDEYAGERADLALSLDVIYHLVEDVQFHSHMTALFTAASRYVLIYSSNTDQPPGVTFPHVRHRLFTRWVERYRPDWRLVRQIPNRYPDTGDNRNSSFADFYRFEKQPGGSQ